MFRSSHQETYVWQNVNCQVHNVMGNEPLWIEHVSASNSHACVAKDTVAMTTVAV